MLEQTGAPARADAGDVLEPAAAARLLPAAAVAGDREAVGLVAYLLDPLQAGGCSTWMQLPGRLPVDARQQQGFVAGPARLALGHAHQHPAVDAPVGQHRPEIGRAHAGTPV